MNDEAAIAEECAHAFLEGNVWVEEACHVGCTVCFTILPTEVTNLAGFWARSGAWDDFATEEGIKMGEGGVAVVVGCDRVDMDVETWIG